MMGLLKELLNEILTYKDKSKVFVLCKGGQWKASRWSKLEKGDVARFLYPKGWENYVDPQSMHLMLDDSFKINGTWGVRCVGLKKIIRERKAPGEDGFSIIRIHKETIKTLQRGE